MSRCADQASACFECLRAAGITDHSRPDSLGKMRWAADGRYVARHVERKDETGNTVETVSERGALVGG